MDSSFLCLFTSAFALLHLTDSQSYRCDYKYESVADGWFKYHDVPVIWHDARLMCALEGGILASPTMRDIQTAMMKSCKHTPFFTGLHATVSKGQYFSIDGVPLEHSQMVSLDTDSDLDYHMGGCLAMDCQGRLTNVNCYKPRSYMCFRKSSLEPNECGTTDPDYHLDTRTNKCYKFHTVPRNFSRANFACSAEGGHLAIINSNKEAKVLKDLFATIPTKQVLSILWKDAAFIGFHDWGEHGDWRTVHGQTLKEAGYNKFSMVDNMTPGENCGSIYRNGKLHEISCELLYPFICEKSPDYPPLCDMDGNVIKSKEEKIEAQYIT